MLDLVLFASAPFSSSASVFAGTVVGSVAGVDMVEEKDEGGRVPRKEDSSDFKKVLALADLNASLCSVFANKSKTSSA